MKTFRDPETVHTPIAGYTHQIEVTGPTRWLVLSGQIGRTQSGEVPEDPIDQLRLALKNLRAQLDAAGMTLTDLTKVTLYLVGEMDPDQRRQVITQWAGGHRPCMAVMYVSALASAEYRVEVDAWACASSAAPQ